MGTGRHLTRTGTPQTSWPGSTMTALSKSVFSLVKARHSDVHFFFRWLQKLTRSSLHQDTVVTNDRWGAGCACKHGGYYNCEDKYTPGQLPQHKWEKCTSVDTYSWGYRRNMKMSELMDLPSIVEVRICDSMI